ncbi:hypothetical protein [Cypionkella sp. TWP1-2-1b2]|uniref:hypothetical protein n=1 Tax=Cypionkella sp. TWP1-2-1b2 TaxID=2804675 RepID=UPI003CF8D643
MFNTWKIEKAKLALIGEAQGLADKLAQAKPHIVDSHAAAARFWAAYYLAAGQDLQKLIDWPPATVARFCTTAQAKIAVLRKQREYDSSDGLAIWLHTARAVIEPRIAPAAREIWQLLLAAGPNVEAMTRDLLQDAGLPFDQTLQIPEGFSLESAGHSPV